MANRQHGRRSPAGGRTARAVPVSRSPAWAGEPAQPAPPAYTEPEVRRWPHPRGEPPAPPPEPAMHYIRCALSYQNQLLADIKALLEQLAASPAAGKPPDQEKGGENLSKL